MNTENNSKKETSTVTNSHMEWWNGLHSLRKTQICDTNTDIVGNVRRWETLTSREIKMIYKKSK